ncbi:MAG TPA: class F sortase [Dehalococcoidia bacterium]|nr:class F sortase [Dehalococcoidia bacterium]
MPIVIEGVPTSLPFRATATSSAPPVIIQPPSGAQAPAAVVALAPSEIGRPAVPADTSGRRLAAEPIVPSAVAPDAPPSAPAPTPPLVREPGTQVHLTGRAAGPIPRHIQIPDIGVSATMVPVGLEPSGLLASPNGPDIVGWYAGSPRPGQPGNLLIDGHRDWHEGPRPAVFWSLDRLSPNNSQIVIWTDTEGFVYLVTENFGLHRDDPNGRSVLAPTADSTITLITCEGSFSPANREYDNRRVVKARLVGTLPR